MSENDFLISSEGPVKTFTLNAPKKKNALSVNMLMGLADCLKESAEDGTRILILTGAGGNFSTGADLNPSEMNPADFDVSKYLTEIVNPVILGLRRAEFLTVSRVQGFAVGLGLSLSLACDAVIADESAVFSPVFTGIGLSTDGGAAYFLAESLGYRKATQMICSAERMSGKEAEKAGLINACTSADDLDMAVTYTAGSLAAGPFVAFRMVKRNMRAITGSSLEEALAEEARNQAVCFKTKDFAEGVTAFFEKRAPKFRGE